jgi:hypothetical protein
LGAPIAAVAAGLLIVAGTTALRWHQSWDFSEGVYALTSRLLVHGRFVRRGRARAVPSTPASR